MISLYSTDFDRSLKAPLYTQLYEKIRSGILGGSLQRGERLPSLRALAQQSGLSVTSAQLAYDQLQTEGYIYSRPQSGYYVAELPQAAFDPQKTEREFVQYTAEKTAWRVDLEAFDFRGWKRCVDRVYGDYRHLLLTEGDLQGEAALRFEIAKYVQEARGVQASPEQVVIGAGTQQLTGHLARMLRRQSLNLISVEDPGYLPIRRMLKDEGFTLAKIPVTQEGIDLERLPVNVPSAVYVSPANQFPTGAVMPISNRYKLLQWAEENHSLIIEDDYNSELRYFGRPIPALQGLDAAGCVIYMGSFTSTLFPAVRISYMILPETMMPVFSETKDAYLQTCSRTDQLALALFMEDGSYHKHIRRIRTLYAKKLQQTVQAFQRYGKGQVTPQDTRSGISLLLMEEEGLDEMAFCRRGEALGARIIPAEYQGAHHEKHLIFYYNRIPVDEIPELVRQLCRG